jgi:cytochrome c-type biogenesis protein
MQYLIVFLEGLSPLSRLAFYRCCRLPFLFCGRRRGGGTSGTLRIALGFVKGFTVVFTALGALAGSLGAFLYRYSAGVNLIAGLGQIALGLSFFGVVPLRLFGGNRPRGSAGAKPGFAASGLFGAIFAVGWTPCVGAFLGSALMMAATAGGRVQGT